MLRLLQFNNRVALSPCNRRGKDEFCLLFSLVILAIANYLAQFDIQFYLYCSRTFYKVPWSLECIARN